MKVYLAGPIFGCTDDEAHTWREVVKEHLGEANCIDPMRRDYRGIEDANVNAIVNDDYDDIDASSVVLANCWKPGWGTPMEIHYAYTCSKHVIAICPPGPVSPWLTYHAGIVHSLEEALAWLEREFFHK